MVLLMMFTPIESCIEIPPPSQPATLLVMILLVTVTWYHFNGGAGNVITSLPLMSWKRRPPPLPLSAALPIIRLALITRPGPVPSLIPTGQSPSRFDPGHTGSASGSPMTTIPPPLAVTVGLTLWLNNIQLLEISPL